MVKINPTTRPKQKITPMFLVFATILVGLGIAVAAQFLGLIELRGILNSNSGAYELPPTAIIGEEYSYDFSSELIPLLPSDSLGGPYTFYLDSGVGFYPMGLTLDIDGKLHGIPKTTAGNFRVCVKDVSGKSACKTYHLDVGSKAQTASPSTLGTGSGTLWEGTMSKTASNEMPGEYGGICTKKYTAKIRICMKRAGQDVTGTYNLYDYSETSTEKIGSGFCPIDAPVVGGTEIPEFSGKLDSTGNLNVESFDFQDSFFTSNPNSPYYVRQHQIIASISDSTIMFNLLSNREDTNVYNEVTAIGKEETNIVATKIAGSC